MGRLLLAGMFAFNLLLSVLAAAPGCASSVLGGAAAPMPHHHDMAATMTDAGPAPGSPGMGCGAADPDAMACCALGHCPAFAALPAPFPAQSARWMANALPAPAAAAAPDGTAPGPALRPPRRAA